METAWANNRQTKKPRAGARIGDSANCRRPVAITANLIVAASISNGESTSSTMANYATPILYLNMGGEMLYVLQQRLQTQRICPDKSVQVINDVVYALLSPKQLRLMFDEGPLMSLTILRASLERVALSSIMRLDTNSMNKLFDLMIMMVKYQLATASGPREVVLLTLNHLDALRDMALDRCLTEHIELAYQLVIDTYGNMSYKDIWQIRSDCLRELQGHNVRVSILLRLGMQNPDASFNRLIQRYDEKYRDRREILENVKLLEYSDDEGIMGSLSYYGDRVTLLGKNVYAASYGHVRSSRSTPSLQSLATSPVVSNKCARQELETLARQLGKEEAQPQRPFSLHLFSTEDERALMDCSEDATAASGPSQLDEDADLSNGNPPVNEYRDSLYENVNSQFAEGEASPRPRDDDLMNFIDVV